MARLTANFLGSTPGRSTMKRTLLVLGLAALSIVLVSPSRLDAVELPISGGNNSRCVTAQLSTDTKIVVSKCAYAVQSVTGWTGGTYCRAVGSLTACYSPYNQGAYPAAAGRYMDIYVGPYASTPYGSVAAGQFLTVSNHSFGPAGAFGSSSMLFTARPSAAATIVRCRSAGVAVWQTSNQEECANGGTLSAALLTAMQYPFDWFPGGTPTTPPVPTCVGAGVSMKIGGVEITPSTQADFFTRIDWSIALPAGASVDQLMFVERGPTPLGVTGNPPAYRPGILDGYSSDEQFWSSSGAVGIGLQWVVRPGYAATQVVGPATISGVFTWLGVDGSYPHRNITVMCRMLGYSMETFQPTGSALNQLACSNVTVRPYGEQTDALWSLRVVKEITTTPLVRVEWSYDGGAWSSLLTPTTPQTSAISNVVTIDRPSTPNFSLLDFRCVGGTVAGPNQTVGVSVTDPANGAGGSSGDGTGLQPTLSSCFGDEGLGSMSLTSPKSWVIGIGRMGVCVVKAMVIPSDAGGWLDEQVATLSGQAPFSFLAGVIDFLDVATNPAGTASSCFGNVTVPGGSSSAVCLSLTNGNNMVAGDSFLQGLLLFVMVGFSVLAFAVGSLRMLF